MLNYTYNAKEEIPEGQEQFYSEQGGKYVLQTTGENPNIVKLKETLKSERQLTRESNAKLKEYESKYSVLPDDFDVNEYNRLKDSSGGDIDAKMTEQRERIQSQYEKKLKQKDEIIAQKDGLIDLKVKEASLLEVMAENGVGEQYSKAVKAMMKSRVSIEGETVLLDNLPIKESFKDWASSEEGQIFVKAPENGGGGANPANKDTKNTNKTISRAEFDKLPREERTAVLKEGVKPID